MVIIAADMKAGDVARTWPQTVKVFLRYGLTLNCGGEHTLEFAARKHGFNLEKMLQELNAAITSAPAPFS